MTNEEAVIMVFDMYEFTYGEDSVTDIQDAGEYTIISMDDGEIFAV